MKRPMTGESRNEAAIQPRNTIASDIILPPKIARVAAWLMIGGVPCQEIKIYVFNVYMKSGLLASGLHAFHIVSGPLAMALWASGGVGYFQ
jgi:hypothetical protein